MFGRNQKVKVVDDFLPLHELEELQQIMIYRYDFPMYYQDRVAITNLVQDHPWNWYQTHMLYNDNQSRSPYYEPIANIFLPKLKD